MPHIILLGSSFHHVTCSVSQFQLEDESEGFINKQCARLESDEKLQAILRRGEKTLEQLPPTTNNALLNHKQLSQKCCNLRMERNLLQLELMKKSKRLKKLNSVLKMYQRFMILISENNVLRLKELVGVALRNNNHSISYIVQ